jgi:hypothetical protein
VSYPLGTATSPIILPPGTNGVTLSLTGPTAKADLYRYRVYDDGAWMYTLSSENTSIGITGLSSGNLYSWTSFAENTTCGTGVTSPVSNRGYFRVNSVPAVGNFRIKNNSGTVIPAEVVGGQNRNHICQTSFLGSRNVRFELDVSDADGIDDINQVSLTWNGISYTLSRGTTAGIGGTYFVNVDYSGVHNSGVDGIGATVTDDQGQSVSSTVNRYWKVWNCQVATSGQIFDGSAGQACNSTGFTSPMSTEVNFTDLAFRNAGTGETLWATTMGTAFLSTNLAWGQSYLPLFSGGTTTKPNGNLKAFNRITRLINTGVGTTSCPVDMQFNLNASLVDPYYSTTTAKLDFSFIRFMNSWFQVAGSGVKAKQSLVSGVPVTAPEASRFLTLGKKPGG